MRRITLGRYGEITVEQARKEAQKLLGKYEDAVGRWLITENPAKRLSQARA